MAPVLEEESSPYSDDGNVDESEEFDDHLSDDGTMAVQQKLMTKTERLVEWNVEVLSKLLKQILAARVASSSINLYFQYVDVNKNTNDNGDIAIAEKELAVSSSDKTTTVLDEFKETITMPIFSSNDLKQRKDPSSIELPIEVIDQLRHLTSLIAAMYRPNPFHSFEHACHVTSSVRKLLTRIVNADHGSGDGRSEIVDLAGHSYGIASDALTQFAVVFSAVIHDADHPGVPNTQLLKENTPKAQLYKKSIAEQNSVDLVWNLLMTDGFQTTSRMYIFQ